jgi:hypothetical protein
LRDSLPQIDLYELVFQRMGSITRNHCLSHSAGRASTSRRLPFGDDAGTHHVATFDGADLSALVGVSPDLSSPMIPVRALVSRVWVDFPPPPKSLISEKSHSVGHFARDFIGLAQGIAPKKPRSQTCQPQQCSLGWMTSRIRWRYPFFLARWIGKLTGCSSLSGSTANIAGASPALTFRAGAMFELHAPSTIETYNH